MIKIYAKAIYITLLETLSDIRGVLLNPRITLQEIAERKTWGGSIFFLLLGIAMPLFFTMVDSSSRSIRMPYLETPLFIFCLCISAGWAMGTPRRTIQWKSILRLFGYSGIPWSLFLLIMLTISSIIPENPVSFHGFKPSSSWGGIFLSSWTSFFLGILIASSIYVMTIRLLKLVLQTVYPDMSGKAAVMDIFGCAILAGFLVNFLEVAFTILNFLKTT